MRIPRPNIPTQTHVVPQAQKMSIQMICGTKQLLTVIYSLKLQPHHLLEGQDKAMKGRKEGRVGMPECIYYHILHQAKRNVLQEGKLSA